MFDLSTILGVGLKTSLLISAVGLAAACMARQSAAWRHLLWTGALAFSLAMPIAVAYLPAFVQVSLPRQVVEAWEPDGPVPVSSGLRGAQTTRGDDSPQNIEHSSATGQGATTWPTALLVWLAGAMAVLLRNVLAHIGLIRWMRRSRRGISPAWNVTLRQVTRATGFQRPLRVLESDHATGPCTWGLTRPVLLLPSGGAAWPEPQRRFALLHELAHVRRCDYLASQVANLACMLHWYNPFVWFAATRMRRLQEEACDDAVLRAGEMPSDYAEFLVRVADGSRRLALACPAVVGMVQRSQLHGRVTAILDASRARLPLNLLALPAALVPLACLVVFLATVAAVAAPLRLQPGIPLAATFSSVELRNGGTVNLLHGTSQSVKLVRGDPESSATRIHDGRLVIDRCPKRCPHGREFEVEVVTPPLAAVAVAEGGTMQSRGAFPGQQAIGVSVSQGGRIDIRSMAVQSVTATVYSGGIIFVKPASRLSARIEQGGNVTYWGDAAVTSSIEHGGVVVEGDPADVDRTFADMDPRN